MATYWEAVTAARRVFFSRCRNSLRVAAGRMKGEALLPSVFLELAPSRYAVQRACSFWTMGWESLPMTSPSTIPGAFWVFQH